MSDTTLPAPPPGPWEAYGSSTYVGVRTVVGRKKICAVPLGPNDSATADLLAAAPDMLTALIATEAAKTIQEFAAAEKLRKAAIDKAYGAF